MAGCTVVRIGDSAPSDDTATDTDAITSGDDETLDGPVDDEGDTEPSETTASIDGGEGATDGDEDTTNGDVDCGPALLACNGICVDPSSDVDHCGACDNACALGATCEQGTCACPDGEEVCNDACVDTFEDPASCGACGNQCAAGEACLGGTCADCSVEDCDAVCGPLDYCPGFGCIDTQNDMDHCGACDRSCSGTFSSPWIDWDDDSIWFYGEKSCQFGVCHHDGTPCEDLNGVEYGVCGSVPYDSILRKYECRALTSCGHCEYDACETIHGLGWTCGPEGECVPPCAADEFHCVAHMSSSWDSDFPHYEQECCPSEESCISNLFGEGVFCAPETFTCESGETKCCWGENESECDCCSPGQGCTSDIAYASVTTMGCWD